MKARVRGSASAALLVLTVSMIAFGGTPGAVATQGSAVVTGDWNAGSTTTTVSNVFQAPSNCPSKETGSTIEGFVACGTDGLEGFGTANGVLGRANNGTGVLGQGGENGVDAEGGTFGVFAQGSDYGVFASAPNHGVYGTATAAGGAGIDANGSGGALALRVTGKAKFSRSAVVTIAAGSSSKAITLAGVTSNSMILATAQQTSSVSVKAAVPGSGSFKIFLTGQAPAAGLKVAYFVLN